MIQHILRDALKSATRAAYPHLALPTYEVTRPETSGHGDFSTNLALIFARMVKENPYEVAEKIAAHLPPLDMVERVECARPGFINFYLKPTYFTNYLSERVQTGVVIAPHQESGQRILLEFGQPNTHKIAHVGHLFSYCYGESCSRLLEATGKTVIRANYQGDVGPHVARCLWAYFKKNHPDPVSVLERADYLQVCYQEGSAAYESNDQAKQEIDRLNTRIYAKDPEIMPIWEKTRQWSLDAYAQFQSRLGVQYDRQFLESEVYEPGTELVKTHVGTIFEQDGEAVVFRGEQYGLHTRVFINSRGNPTYEAKDLGLMQKKMEEFSFDRSIVEVGNDQLEYWRVEKQAIELLFPDLKGRIANLHHGMINLTSGKMSSRTGNILGAFALVEMVKAKVLDSIPSDRNYTETEKETIAEVVGIGAIKYSFLKTTPGKDITFDVETSIASEGNSGPYLQYAYARCQSVLRRAGELSPRVTDSLAPNVEEIAILNWLTRYDDAVNSAAITSGPHIIATYLFELAQKYSYFYNQHHILTENKEQTEFRLAITKAVADTLKHGLHLLGIETLEKI